MIETRVRLGRALAGCLNTLAVALAVAACAPGQRPGGGGDADAARRASEGRPIEPALAAATFDTAWARVRDTYYDPALRGVDWDGVRAELYPRAAAARTYGEVRGVLQAMLSRLGESHFGVIPGDIVSTLDEATGDPAVSVEADAGMEMRIVDGHVVVFRVAPDGPAAAAGVGAGWIVESIGGHETAGTGALLDRLGEGERREAELRLTMGLHARLHGAAGSIATVRFRDAAGARIELALARRPVPGTVERFGYLPPTPAHLTHYVVEHEGTRVGVITFNLWMGAALATDFARAVDVLRDTDGIVVDLRGNPGGLASMVIGIGGHFLPEPVSLGVMRRREGELRFVVNPRVVDTQGRAVRPFAGPLAILTDGMTASTSEIFAAGMRAVGRARVFGERTAGQALPAVLTRLPNGDALMHVVADLHAADGSRLEGDGVVPDMVLPLRRDALLANRDEALLGALGWIAGSVAHAEGRAPDAPRGPPAGTPAAGTPPAAATPPAGIPPSAGGVEVDAVAAAAIAEQDAELPSAVSLVERHVAAVGGRTVVSGWTGLRASGRIEIPDRDAAGSLHILQGAAGRTFMRAAVSGYGDVLQGYDGVTGWAVSPGEGARLLRGTELAQLQEEHDLRGVLRDTMLIVAMEAVGRDAFDGEPCHRVRLVWRSGRETADCYSEATGLLIATITVQPTPSAGDAQVITLLGDYRRFDDMLFPTVIRQQLLGSEQVLRIDHVERAELEAAAFAPPAAVQALLRRR